MRNIVRGFRFIPIIGALVTQPPVALAACEAKSGPLTVALLELYTSEGCNSCPPADRWVSELRGRGFGAAQVVPLALHVDYWNDLGWTDQYSQRAFTERQRQLAQHANARTVYTPEFFLNGREYRRWPWNSLGDELKRLQTQPPRADISLALKHANQTLKVDATALTKEKRTSANLYIALYESNLQTRVRAGENAGRTLNHEFVARRLIGPFALGTTGTVRISETIKLDSAWKYSDLGIAAFVQDANDGATLQALALDVCR